MYSRSQQRQTPDIYILAIVGVRVRVLACSRSNSRAHARARVRVRCKRSKIVAFKIKTFFDVFHVLHYIQCVRVLSSL